MCDDDSSPVPQSHSSTTAKCRCDGY